MKVGFVVSLGIAICSLGWGAMKAKKKAPLPTHYQKRHTVTSKPARNSLRKPNRAAFLEDQAWDQSAGVYIPPTSNRRAGPSRPIRISAQMTGLTQNVPILIGRRSWWATVEIYNEGVPFLLHGPFVQLDFDDYSKSPLFPYSGLDDSGIIPTLISGSIEILHGPNILSVYGDDIGTNDSKKPIRAIFNDESIGSIPLHLPR